MDTNRPARLEPLAPPGRGNRKARAFQFEIDRLLHEGYSLNDIRAALAQAGVRVSKSTVHREALRSRTVRPALASKPLPSLVLGAAAAGPRPDPTTPAARVSNSARSGQDIARAFVDGRITNPLLLARGQR